MRTLARIFVALLFLAITSAAHATEYVDCMCVEPQCSGVAIPQNSTWDYAKRGDVWRDFQKGVHAVSGYDNGITLVTGVRNGARVRIDEPSFVCVSASERRARDKRIADAKARYASLVGDSRFGCDPNQQWRFESFDKRVRIEPDLDGCLEDPEYGVWTFVRTGYAPGDPGVRSHLGVGTQRVWSFLRGESLKIVKRNVRFGNDPRLRWLINIGRPDPSEFGPNDDGSQAPVAGRRLPPGAVFADEFNRSRLSEYNVGAPDSAKDLGLYPHRVKTYGRWYEVRAKSVPFEASTRVDCTCIQDECTALSLELAANGKRRGFKAPKHSVYKGFERRCLGNDYEIEATSNPGSCPSRTIPVGLVDGVNLVTLDHASQISGLKDGDSFACEPSR